MNYEARYTVVAAVIGMAAGVLQLPVAVYSLCKSKRMMTTSSSSAIMVDISLCADVVCTQPTLRLVYP